MNAFASVERLREAAFGAPVRRLHRVVEYSAALGLAGMDWADAHEQIEEAISADGRLPIDRPSQQRAWRFTFDRACEAHAHSLDEYHRHEEVIDLNEYRAAREAPGIFETLPFDAALTDLIAAMADRFEVLPSDTIERIATNCLRRLAVPPPPVRGPAPGEDPFAESWAYPSEREWSTYRRAIAMLGDGPEGGDSEPAPLNSEVSASSAGTAPVADPGVEYQPLDLARPEAWNDPANMPADLRPIQPTPFIWRDPSSLPRREWLYGQHLIRGEISLTLAPGGVGKTSLGCAEAISLVSGKHLLHDAPPKKLRVWLWNGEEPEDELKRRLGAVGKYYGLCDDDFGDRFYVDNGNSLPLVLTEQTRDGIKVLTPIVDRLVAALKERAIDVMLVDPFVSTHGVNENDNSAIQRAASAWKEVAHRAGVAIGLAHHTRKLGGNVATAEDSRGGDALVSKVRDARALNPMSADDARALGIPVADRDKFFYTGVGGKSNMAPRSQRRTWFKIESVGLGNDQGPAKPQDTVGVVTPWSPPKAAEAISAERIMRLAKVMAGQQWRGAAQCQNRPDWIGCAVAEAFDIDQDEGFQSRVRPLLKELERMKVLVRNTTQNGKRELIAVMDLGDLRAYEAAMEGCD